jgi:hypothetical protein
LFEHKNDEGWAHMSGKNLIGIKREAYKELRILSAVAIAMTTLVFTAQTAGATTQAAMEENLAICPAIEVVGTEDGFTLPATTSAGVRTFDVKTSNPNGLLVGIVQLKEGVALEEFAENLKITLTDNSEKKITAGRYVNQNSTMLGGIHAHPDKPAKFTQVLRSGKYYLYNATSAFSNPDAPLEIKTIEVTKEQLNCKITPPTSIIEMVETEEGPHYKVSSVLRAGSPLMVKNSMSHIDEAVFIPVKPDTTYEEMQKYFEALDRGEYPSESLFIGQQQGAPVIHPGNSVIIVPNLSPGKYALFTWVFDLEDGKLRATRGMHTLVTVK